MPEVSQTIGGTETPSIEDLRRADEAQRATLAAAAAQLAIEAERWPTDPSTVREPERVINNRPAFGARTRPVSLSATTPRKTN